MNPEKPVLEAGAAPAVTSAGMQRILVLGMGCSGTSFVTKFLGLSGAFAGDVTKKYEHKVSYDIDYPILETFGARKGLPYGRLPEEDIQAGNEWREKVARYVGMMDAQAAAAGAKCWLYKDPRATVLTSLWAPHFNVYVGVFRHPEQVARSYLSKGWIGGWFKKATVFRYWERFNHSLLALYRRESGAKPFYMIDFNGDLLAQLKRVCRQLGLEPSAEAVEGYDGNRHSSAVQAPRQKELRETYDALRQTVAAV